MRREYTLSKKLLALGSVLLVVAVLSIGFTLLITWKLEGGAAAVNETGRIRMQAWQLTSTAQAPNSLAQVQALVAKLDSSFDMLKRGEPSRPLFMPSNAEVAERFATVHQLWGQQRARWLMQGFESVEASALATTQFVESIDGLVAAIEHQMSRLTAILNLFQFAMMALAIAGAVIMLYTSYLYVLNPLKNLQQGLRSVESGDFSSRIEVQARDEFGQVATGFNNMAGKLQTMYAGLEAQVHAKTQHIEAQRARLEALYEVSAFLASTSTVEELSRGFAQRVRKIAGADAANVRWSDEASQRFLMLASDCFPKEMADAERSLLAGACACGNLKPDARTRVIPIHDHDAAPMRNCARAGYQNLVSVPVRLQQRLIGEIDLFFRGPVQLTAESAELLDTLASHLASALEGLRAAALEREAAVSEERTLLARELHDSIAQSLAFLKIQVQLLRNATRKAQAGQVETALDELDAGLRESIADVRELLVHFRTRTNTENIEAALEETLEKFKQQSGLVANLHIKGEGLPLPADVQIQVLHVVQEALSNVRKHARATHVDVDVIKGAGWQFVVRDDGHGFDVTRSHDTDHVGLKIMHERAAKIGASVAIESEVAAGTSVALSLPAHVIKDAGSEALIAKTDLLEASGERY